MSSGTDGSVETSNNIGIMELKEDGFHLVSNHRSQKASRLEEIMMRVDAIAQLAGAKTEPNKMTSPWEPLSDSYLLEKCRQVYLSEFGEDPKVETTHGGLECGVLSERCGGLDCLSLGPTIINAHSPDESLFVPSVSRVWTFLAALLGSY
jgi:dipeptidase D